MRLLGGESDKPELYDWQWEVWNWIKKDRLMKIVYCRQYKGRLVKWRVRPAFPII